MPADAKHEKAVSGTLTLFAAAALTEPLDLFAAKLRTQMPGLRVKANYAGTQELRMQVEQGARFDVFVAASKEDMKTLADAGRVRDARVLAHNTLCVAVDPANRKIRSLEDLAAPGTRLVVTVATCPAGRYARKSWGRMKEDRAFGPDFVKALQARVVSEETNVKLAIAKVVMGEADAAFVYRTDVVGQKVRKIDVPESVQVQATYMVGFGAQAQTPEAAEAYIKALLGPTGRAVLKQYGFIF